MIEAYPLQWPLHKKRTNPAERKSANFSKREQQKSTFQDHIYSVKSKLTLYEACKRVLSELDKYTKPGKDFRVDPDTIVISTNIPIRKDGLPYSNYKKVQDPGAAVYFVLDGKQYCLPCDKWDKVEDNIAAIAAHISALRGIERWGVGESKDAYSGYKALPEQSTAEFDIWEVLGLTARPDSVEIVKNAFRHKAKQLHPDNGGSAIEFNKLNEAYRKALLLFM